MSKGKLLLTLIVAALLGGPGLASAADLSQAVMLVAKPQVRDELFGASVLVVVPVGGDRHVGFIVNRPTPVALGTVFPERGAAQKVAEPVYIGGPSDADVIFALVQRPASRADSSSFELLPGLSVAYESAAVERIIDADPEHARFVAGLVAWQPGELADEIGRGAWYVLDPDAAVVLRPPEGLWEDLVRRSERAANTI
jgi:putative transcriptional regulator